MTRYTKLEGRRALPAGAAPEEAPADEPAPPAAEAQPEARADPKKLLKRAKLMRLKAKKTNSDEHRAAFLKKLRELEREANKVNGQRGVLGKHARADRTAARRKERAEKRASEMRCYVCRGAGHSAKDCTQDTGTDGRPHGRDTVGICFRCGSTEHNLSKCPKPASDSLPFATCYVCSQMGHLASRCPKNRGHGIYPNGGDCNICHSVEHLARDCPNAKKRDDEQPERPAAPAPPPKKVVSF